MGMSTHIIGFRPPDDQWRRMKAVWDSCVSANVPVPDAVGKFFDWQEPDENGVEVVLRANEWSDYSRAGYELRIDQILPDNVTIIRFYNSY